MDSTLWVTRTADNVAHVYPHNAGLSTLQE